MIYFLAFSASRGHKLVIYYYTALVKTYFDKFFIAETNSMHNYAVKALIMTICSFCEVIHKELVWNDTVGSKLIFSTYIALGRESMKR